MLELTPFGQALRAWRKQRGFSQLELAVNAQSTPRHISFLETGRSRPGESMVLRLAECLDLPIRDRNALLQSAGLPPAFEEHDLNDEDLRPYRLAVEALLDRHDPYPACALDPLGRVVLVNRAARALWPGIMDLTPEQSVDAFLGPGPGRDSIENFAEVSWAAVDRMRHEANRTQDPRLAQLLERALKHLEGVPRPERAGASPEASPVISPSLRVGDQIIRTFVTVMRFETAREITMSELRVELVFPLDDGAKQFFEGLAAGADNGTEVG